MTGLVTEPLQKEDDSETVGIVCFHSLVTLQRTTAVTS